MTGSRRKRYPLDQSPFFKLQNKRKLARVLGISYTDLQTLLQKGTNNYRIFDEVEDGKARRIQAPKRALRRIHNRLFHLLASITPPDYLHSGVKRRSYITNANAHVGTNRPLVKLDISKFYQSTTQWHVYDFFCHGMQCSSDVAGLLADICTVDSHVPTGSSVSQAIAFYAHKGMFDNIHAHCGALGLTMTCYVDDITISGFGVSKKTLFEVKRLVLAQTLRSARRKERFYPAGKPKLVTGVIVDKDGLRLPNRRHQRIADDLNNYRTASEHTGQLAALNAALSRSLEAQQIDPTLGKKVAYLRQARKALYK